jgi:hypothetical protein
MADPNIYEQLNTKTLSNVSAEEIMNITDKTHIQFQNEYDLERYNLINKATYRDGNIMPDKGGIESQIQTDNTLYVTFRPPKGEVWKIMGIAVHNTATPTGSNTYNTFLSDPVTAALSDVPSAVNDVYYSSVSSSSTNLLTETMFEEVFQPFYITNTMFLRLGSTMSNVGAGGTVKFHVAYMNTR